ncbi:MAG: hypothetical protein QOJ98_891, partial [Acidobacteriota bacterium]|nr:hypothetical protein [Acidobacteriota bacterium]
DNVPGQTYVWNVPAIKKERNE